MKIIAQLIIFMLITGGTFDALFDDDDDVPAYMLVAMYLIIVSLLYCGGFFRWIQINWG